MLNTVPFGHEDVAIKMGQVVGNLCRVGVKLDAWAKLAKLCTGIVSGVRHSPPYRREIARRTWSETNIGCFPKSALRPSRSLLRRFGPVFCRRSNTCRGFSH